MSSEEYEYRAICTVCGDVRFVTKREKAIRFIEAGRMGDVFPCPICGPFVSDMDGKKYGIQGNRYGNPFLTDDWQYACWRARNRDKADGWTTSRLTETEKAECRRLNASFPRAKPNWIQAWVLGNRKVLEGAA